jgi:hypothetical protein
MNEEAMNFLEAHIPELAEVAFKQAYWQALAEGSKVLKVEDGFLIEVSPDGSKKTLKKLPPQMKVTPGDKRMIR